LNRIAVFLLLVGALAAGLAGCATVPSPAPVPGPLQSAIEANQPFFPLDQATRDAILCTALSGRMLADGRFEVLADLMNRSNRPARLQVRCIFKDDTGAQSVDSTPWRPLALAGNSTETVRFTAATAGGRRFTIAARGMK